MDHLMYHCVTDPGALFAGWTVHKSVPGVELNGTDTSGIKPVEVVVAACKGSPRLPWISVLLHGKIFQGDRTGGAVDKHVGVAEAFGVKDLMVVLFSTGQV